MAVSARSLDTFFLAVPVVLCDCFHMFFFFSASEWKLLIAAVFLEILNLITVL